MFSADGNACNISLDAALNLCEVEANVRFLDVVLTYTILPKKKSTTTADMH